MISRLKLASLPSAPAQAAPSIERGASRFLRKPWLNSSATPRRGATLQQASRQGAVMAGGLLPAKKEFFESAGSGEDHQYYNHDQEDQRKHQRCVVRRL